MHEPSANQNRLDSEKCDTQHFKERNPTRWKNSLYDRKKTVIYHTRMTPIGSGYLLLSNNEKEQAPIYACIQPWYDL